MSSSSSAQSSSSPVAGSSASSSSLSDSELGSSSLPSSLDSDSTLSLSDLGDSSDKRNVALDVDDDPWMSDEEEDDWNINVDYTPWIRLRDKVLFVLGVANVALITFFVFAEPKGFPYYYTSKWVLLIGARAAMYAYRNYYYFLLDFCYFGNVLLLIYLWAVPDWGEFFLVVFGICNGPLLWAVITFRNSLVFHSIDRITSAFIHISPALCTYAMRWFAHESRYNNCDEDANCPETGHIVQYLTVYPFIAFVGHQVLYYILVQLCPNKKLKSDRTLLTSYRHLTRNPRSPLARFVNMCGRPMRIPMYGLMNQIYCALTLLPIYLLYTYQEAHTALLALITLWCTWNGGSYYVDVFSRSYEGIQKKVPLAAKVV